MHQALQRSRSPLTSRLISRLGLLSALLSAGCQSPLPHNADYTSTEEPAKSDAPPDCRGLSAETVIQESGCYRLDSDLDVGGSGITIYAGDVDLDLNGHRIRGPGQSSTSAGVHGIGVENLRVFNGRIEGFLYGIRIDPSPEQQSSNVTIRGIDVSNGSARGIYVKARSAIVEHNRVGPLSGYRGWPGSHTIGIEMDAGECRIQSNAVVDLQPESVGEAVAISLSGPTDACFVENNTISNAMPPDYGRSIGFWVAADQKAKPRGALTIQDNTVDGFDYAFMAPVGSRITNNSFSASCKPSDVTIYDAHLGENKFDNDAPPCGDTIERLSEKAALGDWQWKIRLAAALIEHLGRAPRDHCEDLETARSILSPLVDSARPGASDQHARYEGLIDICLAPSARLMSRLSDTQMGALEERFERSRHYVTRCSDDDVAV